MKEVSIKGYNLDRFLNNILSIGIKPRKIKRIDYDELLIEISDKDYKNLLEKKFASCYNISILKSRSKLSTLFSIIKRFGLVAGVALIAIVMFVSSNKLDQITINVNGENTGEIKSKTEQLLKDYDVVVGKPIKVSYRDLENLLVAKLEDSARVLVKKNGNELIIDITQLVEKPELEHSNIVSAFDGKITEIKHSSGVLKVNIGEGVVKGQVLIESGYTGDFFAEARGEIYAKVAISGTAVGSTKTDTVRRTGRVTTVTAFEIFGRQIGLKNDCDFKDIYSSYEIEKEEIFVAKNMILPIKLIKYHVYELESMQTEISEEILIEDLKIKAYNIAKQSFPSGASEGDVIYNVFKDNECYKVVCNIETEISIGERS